MKAWLRTRVETSRWNPGLLGFLTNPYYFSRRALWRGIADLAGTLPAGRLLDVGCGSRPYVELFKAGTYVGLEFDTPANRADKTADLWYDGNTFPVPDHSFDIVLCSQVLEHVFTPQAFLCEIARVLKPGGALILTIPFVWDEHEQPHDFARYSGFGLEHLCRHAGLGIERRQTTLCDARLLVQLAGSQVAKRCLGIRRTGLRLAVSSLWCVPAHVGGTIARFLLPWSGDLYLDQIILARSASTPAPCGSA